MSTAATNDSNPLVRICWQAHLLVTTEAKARKVLARIEASLGLGLQDASIEQCHEDPALYDIEFLTPVPARCVEPGDLVIECLTQARRLGDVEWSVFGLPALDERSIFYWSGSARTGFSHWGIGVLNFSVSQGEVGPL